MRIMMAMIRSQRAADTFLWLRPFIGVLLAILLGQPSGRSSGPARSGHGGPSLPRRHQSVSHGGRGISGARARRISQLPCRRRRRVRKMKPTDQEWRNLFAEQLELTLEM